MFSKLSLESESVTQLCPTLCDPVGCSLPASSAYGILQAKILEWIAILSSRGSSRPRDWPWVSCIAGRFFSIWATHLTFRLYLWIFFLSWTIIKFYNCELYAVSIYVVPKFLYIIKSHIEHFFHTVEGQVLGVGGVGHNSMLMIL